MAKTKKTSAMIRFSGSERAIAAWAVELARVIPTRDINPGPNSIFLLLSVREREAIEKALWREESGLGNDANGRPLLWNDCIGWSRV